MSEPEAAPVERLKGELQQAQAAAVAARAAAEAAAARLRVDPNTANQRARDEAISAIEVHDLSVERAKRAFQEAQRAEWQDELGRLGAAHGDDVSAAGPLWDQLVGAVATVERVTETFKPFQRRARQRTARAREIWALLGGSEHDRPGFMITLPKPNEINRRLEALPRVLTKLSLPQWW